MKEIAHRGYSEIYKDNTKESFTAAIKHKFICIELDVQISIDNILYIFHDTFIQHKLLSQLTFAEIRKLDYDIMTLQEFFDLIHTDIQIYLDIKATDKTVDRMVYYLYQFLSHLHFKKEDIFIGSFNIQFIKQLFETSTTNNYQLGIITENKFPVDILKILIEQYQLKFISLHWTVLDKDLNSFFKRNNLQIFTYTNKNDFTLQFIKEYPEIDGIVTNYKIL
jgi:glycerophosphoryl diester phosphodiesterase